MDDDYYLDKVCKGDTSSYQYFVNKYKDMAFSIAVSVVKDEFVAEEVVQDAFLNAFNGLKSFNRQSKFSTWLYRIVTNEAFKRLKKMKKEQVVSFVDNYNHQAADKSSFASLNEDEQTYIINEALKRLSPNESLVLRLFYLEEESIKEVSQITGWSESKVKVTLHRARKNMYLIFTETLNFK
ncbi:MAG: RNA polymerase sigma factor [Bacteroidota bacterium]